MDKEYVQSLLKLVTRVPETKAQAIKQLKKIGVIPTRGTAKTIKG